VKSDYKIEIIFINFILWIFFSEKNSKFFSLFISLQVKPQLSIFLWEEKSNLNKKGLFGYQYSIVYFVDSIFEFNCFKLKICHFSILHLNLLSRRLLPVFLLFQRQETTFSLHKFWDKLWIRIENWKETWGKNEERNVFDSFGFWVFQVIRFISQILENREFFQFQAIFTSHDVSLFNLLKENSRNLFDVSKSQNFQRDFLL